MSLSFSGLTTYGKLSLPCVSYPTIKRDGPQARFTYRREKVGDQPLECDMINRAEDTINRVARTTAGADRNQALLYSHLNRKLPYRIMRQGEFRPYVAAPTDLLPLSKQRRGNTTIEPIYTLPGNTDRNVNKERGNKESILSCSAGTAITYLPFKHQRAFKTDLIIKPTVVIEKTAPISDAPYIQMHERIGPGAGADANRLQVTIENFKQYPTGQDHVTRARDTRAHVKLNLTSAAVASNPEGPQKFVAPSAEFYRTNQRLNVGVDAGTRVLARYNTTDTKAGAGQTRATAQNVGAQTSVGYSLSKVFHPEVNTRARQQPVRASMHTSSHKQYAGGLQTQHFDSQVTVKGRAGIIIPQEWNIPHASAGNASSSGALTTTQVR